MKRNYEEENEEIIEKMKAALENALSSAFNDYVSDNAEFRAKAGLKTYIIREELSTCCKWCHDLAGKYDYGSEPADVYRRHDRCKCMVLFRNEKGKYQDVWSKKKYDDYNSAKRERINKNNNVLRLSKDDDTIKRMELSSTKSTKKSLESVYEGKSGLNQHRRSLLKRVPQEGDWASLERGTVETRDLAYLSADQKHEFALWRSKMEDIICHGNEQHCELPEEIYDKLISGKYELVAHTHVDRGPLRPSVDDIKVLNAIGQKKSILVSIDGTEKEFMANIFDI